MPELSTDEYAIIMKSLLHASAYVKPETEAGKLTREAIQILKQTTKGVPSGGSSSFSIPKEQKLKRLFGMFGIDNPSIA